MYDAMPTDNELADRALNHFQYAMQHRSQLGADRTIATLSAAVRVAPTMGTNVLTQALTCRAEALFDQKQYDVSHITSESEPIYPINNSNA